MAEPAFDRRSIPESAHESTWRTEDGWEIRRLDWLADGPATEQRGSLLFMPGRGDIYEKYLESFADFHKLGWNVTSSDWRGQGGSGRLGDSQYLGHIEDFRVWVADLADFFAEWKAQTPGPHVVVAHSMGGHLVGRALIEHAIDPDAAVLVVPMLGFYGFGLPAFLGHLAARVMTWIGNPGRHAWKVSEKPASPLAIRQTLLTHDKARYEDELWWWGERPGLVMGPPSWRWVERAYASARYINAPGRWEKVAVPVLLLGTDKDELVRYDCIAKAAHRIPQGELKTFSEGCAHEILRELDAIRDEAITAIASFLDRVAPRSAG